MVIRNHDIDRDPRGRDYLTLQDCATDGRLESKNCTCPDAAKQRGTSCAAGARRAGDLSHPRHPPAVCYFVGAEVNQRGVLTSAMAAEAALFPNLNRGAARCPSAAASTWVRRPDSYIIHEDEGAEVVCTCTSARAFGCPVPNPASAMSPLPDIKGPLGQWEGRIELRPRTFQNYRSFEQGNIPSRDPDAPRPRILAKTCCAPSSTLGTQIQDHCRSARAAHVGGGLRSRSAASPGR